MGHHKLMVKWLNAYLQVSFSFFCFHFKRYVMNLLAALW